MRRREVIAGLAALSGGAANGAQERICTIVDFIEKIALENKFCH
jgi:hypothetical protein